MNLNAAIEALDSVRFFNCRMAGMEGVEPSPLSRARERDSRSTYPLILFWSTSWANLTQGWTDTLSLTRGQQVSRSHKPRPPKFKLPGLTRSVTLGAGTRRPRSATTYTVGAGSTAGGANFARLLRRFAAAVVVGLKDGFHPLSAASCGNRKELTPLSSHAFVRSMTWAWCHSRHLPEKLASSTKAFIIITLIIKNATIY